MAASQAELLALTGRPVTGVFHTASAGNDGQPVPGTVGAGPRWAPGAPGAGGASSEAKAKVAAPSVALTGPTERKLAPPRGRSQ